MLLERGEGGEKAEERERGERGRGFWATGIACKYGESDDRSENSDFLFFDRVIETLLVNYFKKYTFKGDST